MSIYKELVVGGPKESGKKLENLNKEKKRAGFDDVIEVRLCKRDC